ncbi:hypothetical protein [Sulfurivirga sp.]|uniref:hypothetical protein n=1 Tax=Sulfurivirga sp. TaxID=2614236 RepID=UPI0025E2AEB1|nr:hypothetical protein [Sulfurivirga sp.]
MKKLTLKALFAAAFALAAVNAQAGDSQYDKCITEGEKLIEAAKKEGRKAADNVDEQLLASCKAELTKMEVAAMKRAGVDPAKNTHNPYKFMTGEERVKWSKLWEAVDAMQGRGVRFLQNAWYGGDPGARLDAMEKQGKIPAEWR